MLPAMGRPVFVIEVEATNVSVINGRPAMNARVRTQAHGTPGGARLRALREERGRTQLWVEAEAGLGSGYLQRLESGRVAQPGRATIERILAALAARYGERRLVLELFGYRAATPPPTAEETAWAASVCHAELHAVTFPAYVLDCTNRLVAWNRQFPRLLGVTEDDPLLLRLTGRSLLAPWFEPGSPLAALVVEPETLLPALIRALRYELQQFRAEPWCTALLGRLVRDLPCFRHYWDLVEREPAPASAARARVPLRLRAPGAGVLEFRLSSEPFVLDPRFRVINYFPANPATMRQCAAWAEAGGAQ